jgi:RNA polymerase-binding transcription factor DksA
MNTEHFKDKLEAELKLVTKELNDLGWKDPETGEWDATGKDLDVTTPMADSNEAADQLEEYGERQGETSTLEARRNDVKDALAKIADGTYGKCEVSGEEIEEDRLEANPAARTCKAHMSA